MLNTHCTDTQQFTVAGRVQLFTSHMNGFKFIASVFIVLKSKTNTIAVGIAVLNTCFH